MRFIKEYNQYDKFTVLSYDDNFEDLEAVDFEVVIEMPDGEEETIYVNYQIFLDFVKQTSPTFSDYILSHKELDSFEDIFSDLQELGFDFKDYLQKWVDININEENLKMMK